MKFFRKTGKKRTSRPSALRSDEFKNVYNYYGSEQLPRDGARQSSEGGPKKGLLPITVVCILVLLGLIFSLTLSTRPSISFANQRTNLYRAKEEYESAAEILLKQNIANNFKLSANTQEIEEKLLEQFPELAAVAFRLPVIGRRANLIVEQKEPALILTTVNKSFVLDLSGIIICDLQTLNSEARQGLVVVLDQSGLELKVGDQAVTSETVQFILNAMAQLKAQNLAIAQLTLPPLANQLNIQLKDVPYYIKTDVSGDAMLQIGSYLAVKTKLERDKITPSEYVDVRVEEKVFYK